MSSKSVFFLTVLALLLSGVEAATITVGSDDCDHVSVQAAIDAACSGDVVVVGGGTYRENLVVDKSLVIRAGGNGTEKPIIDAGGRGSAVTLIADGVQLEGFVLENAGFGRAGIDVRSKDNLIRGNLVTDNIWYGIFLDGSSGSVIEENLVWKNKYGIWINPGSNENRILKNVLENNENYNAFDLGTNFWNENFYGDFDGSEPDYEVPGISSVDESPSGPEKEPVVEVPSEVPEKVTEEDNPQDMAGEDLVGEDVAGEEAIGRIAPDSKDDLAEVGSSVNPAAEPSAFEKASERPGLSPMYLGQVLKTPSEEGGSEEGGSEEGGSEEGGSEEGGSEEGGSEASRGSAVGDSNADGELRSSDANESAMLPVVVDGPPEATLTTVEAFTSEGWVLKGDSLCRSGRYSEAVGCYDQAISMEPELAEAWDGKGDALQMTGNYDKAVKCYDEAIAIDPDFAESWYNKGNTLQMLLKFDEAMGCYEEALRIEPTFVEAWNKKGMTLNRQGRYQEALDCFDEAIAIEPGYAAAWNNKSWALQMLGEGDAAKEAFDKAKALGYS